MDCFSCQKRKEKIIKSSHEKKFSVLADFYLHQWIDEKSWKTLCY
jgi:hypothetical protein